MTHRGITAFGAYLPRHRLLRRAIAVAHAWTSPNAVAAEGTRAICGHDEDSITLAVAAGRQVLPALASGVDRLLFASTSMPFADRQNATLIGEALTLPATLRTLDVGGSQRCGTGALLSALEGNGNALVIAAEQRQARPGSAQELLYGDGAVALTIGDDEPLARFIGAHSLSVDFTDHYRASHADYDYALEERWVREEGHLKLIPRAITGLLENSGAEAARIDHFIVGGVAARNAQAIATRCGIRTEAVVDDLHSRCGDTGSAHPLLLLARTLENARAGTLILVAGFGQGCDALLFEVTETIARAPDHHGVAAALAAGFEDDNYLRYLSHTGALRLDWGMRAERDNRTAHAAFQRHRHTVTGCIGGRCQQCGTPQFPKTRVCANPECRTIDSQVDEPFRDKAATVKSYTEDWLALSYNPPLMYGNVRFAGGGVAMLEFTDFAPGELRVGTPLALQFRIKDHDEKRGFHRYCWKAAPAANEPVQLRHSTTGKA